MLELVEALTIASCSIGNSSTCHTEKKNGERENCDGGTAAKWIIFLTFLVLRHTLGFAGNWPYRLNQSSFFAFWGILYAKSTVQWKKTELKRKWNIK
jgi:hypothetical protein